jgi:hypothetical protein
VSFIQQLNKGMAEMLAKAALQPQSKTQRRCGYERPAGPEANEFKAIKNFTGQQCFENYRKKKIKFEVFDTNHLEA